MSKTSVILIGDGSRESSFGEGPSPMLFVAAGPGEGPKPFLSGLLKKAKAVTPGKGVSGQLVGPGTDPEKLQANVPFSIGYAANIAIAKDSKPGDYIFLFRLSFYAPGGQPVSQKTQAWQVDFKGGRDWGIGWALSDDDVPGQKAGAYTIESSLTVIVPGATKETKLDSKKAKIVIA